MKGPRDYETGSSTLLDEIRAAGELPRHVAVIMDGNGRWARRRNRPRVAGHRAGAIAAARTIEAARTAGIEVLTLFAFSQENWRRPVTEVAALMAGLELHLRRDLHRELRQKGVTVRVLGDLDRLGPRHRVALARLVAGTRGGSGLRLNLALSYGARAEIVKAARRLAQRVERGTLTAAEIDETMFAANLYTAGLPDPDLLIRTSGECRVSNFLLWQIAYAELHITPVLWPDFAAEHLYAAIREFQRRDRRYGRLANAAVGAGV
jgi:undecaprenyl diphosphate synthase